MKRREILGVGNEKKERETKRRKEEKRKRRGEEKRAETTIMLSKREIPGWLGGEDGEGRSAAGNNAVK